MIGIGIGIPMLQKAAVSGGGGFSRTAFLSDTGDDGTAELNNPDLPYLTLVTAAEELLAAYPGQTTTIRFQSDFSGVNGGISSVDTLMNDGLTLRGHEAERIIGEINFGDSVADLTLADLLVDDLIKPASGAGENAGLLKLNNTTIDTLSLTGDIGVSGISGSGGGSDTGDAGSNGSNGDPPTAGGSGESAVANGGNGTPGETGRNGFALIITDLNPGTSAINTIVADGGKGGTAGAGGDGGTALGGNGGVGGDSTSPGPQDGGNGGNGGNASANGGNAGDGGTGGNGADLEIDASITIGTVTVLGGEGGETAGGGASGSANGGNGGSGGSGANGGMPGVTGNPGSAENSPGSAGNIGAAGSDGSVTYT